MQERSTRKHFHYIITSLDMLPNGGQEEIYLASSGRFSTFPEFDCEGSILVQWQIKKISSYLWALGLGSERDLT